MKVKLKVQNEWMKEDSVQFYIPIIINESPRHKICALLKANWQLSSLNHTCIRREYLSLEKEDFLRIIEKYAKCIEMWDK